MTATADPATTPQFGTEIPLLELQHVDLDERPAYVPRHLDRFDVRGLIADAHPELDQAHQLHRARREIVHAYRDRTDGAWVIAFERLDAQFGAVKEFGETPLWDKIVSLVGMWNAAGRPADHRSLR